MSHRGSCGGRRCAFLPYALARCNDSLVQPIFARSTAIGSLMRRKIKPVTVTILQDIAALRG